MLVVVLRSVCFLLRLAFDQCFQQKDPFEGQKLSTPVVYSTDLLSIVLLAQCQPEEGLWNGIVISVAR